MLQCVINKCGSVAGVITLRDGETASLLLPDETVPELAAPLIQGLEAEFIASYIDHYAALDPWTMVEREHYPYIPYFMSDHLSVANLKETGFWKWLEPQGIEDAIIAEIYQSHSHWVALSLYFDKSAQDRKPQILKELGQLLPTLNTGWGIAEEIVGLRQKVLAGQSYLDGWPVPCLILDEEFIITSANRTGLKQFPRFLGSSTVLAVGEVITIDHQPLLDGIETLLASPQTSDCSPHAMCIKSKVPGYSIGIAIVAHARDMVGRKRAQFFAYIKPECEVPAVGMAGKRIWENPSLTDRQAAIVRWIAEGGTIPQFAKHNRISTKTAYDHLLAARQKLNNISARDIYTTHQAYLMLEDAPLGAWM